MEHQNEQKKLKNTIVFKLGAISFLADVSSEMLYPITPIFLTSVLGSNVASVGLIEGLADAISSLLKTYSGTWSDKIKKRKPFILFGYLLSAISKPLTGLSQQWLDVLAIRSLDRVGKGLRTAPRDAMLSDSVEPKDRGRAFGIHRAMDTMGAVIGPLLALYFINSANQDLRHIYFWSLIPSLFSVVIVLWLKDQTIPTSTSIEIIQNNNFKKQSNLSKFEILNQFDKNFKNYLIAWGVFSLTNSSDVFILLKTKELGYSLTETILVYCLFNFIYASLSPYLGILSDKIDRKVILKLGLIIFFLVYLGFSFADKKWHIIILYSLYGFYMAATEGIGKAIAIDLSPNHLKATGVGLLGTITGVSTIFASTVGGLLWESFGSQWTFLYGALGALITLSIISTKN